MNRIDYTILKKLRKERGINQEQIADKLCMTQSNYSKLENGQKMINSIEVLEDIAAAFELPLHILIGMLEGRKNLLSAGMNTSELFKIQELLKENPLREDEFVYFSEELEGLEKHDFKELYPTHEIELLPLGFSLDVNIIEAESVNLKFEFENDEASKIIIWLGDKKLGEITSHKVKLINELVFDLMISRVLLIENVNKILGSYDTYMKAVFIATNAQNKSAHFEKGRFSGINFLSNEEIESIENAKQKDNYDKK